MSASAGGSSQDATIPSSQKLEKTHKRTKSGHKKRAREDDEAAVVEETPRKSKKTKNFYAKDGDQEVQPEKPLDVFDKPAKKKKKNKEHDDGSLQEDGIAAPDTKKERKKSSKRAKNVDQSVPVPMDVDLPEVASKKRKQKKSRKEKVEEDEVVDADATRADEIAPERKEKKKSKDKATETLGADETSHSQEAQATQESSISELPVGTDYPFFTQTVSLYVPFFPLGFDKPITNVASQHLDPLLNHYSPVLRGVLLSYSNVNLSDRPTKASVTHPPTDQTPALLHSIDEYAVGFGWLTFDAHLFIPSRGKWMEGVVQLQSEGHIGVVCWNKFNASIEASRLPAGWRWVDLAKGGPRQANSLASDDKEAGQEEQQSEDMLDGEELQVVEQIHTTGYWVNEHGRKVNGKLRFRIKNFDVGLAGDYGYLSIEGTCLDEVAERALGAEERQSNLARRARQNPAGLLRPLSRRVPEFSMTRFGREDREEDDAQRVVLYKGSRPGTPDD